MNPLEALLGLDRPPAAFGPTSRYHGIDTVTAVVDGRPVVYLRRRFVPPPAAVPSVPVAAVRAVKDRLDRLAAHYLGDPELFWRLCDASGVMSPAELDVPGAVPRVPTGPLPAGGAHG